MIRLILLFAIIGFAVAIILNIFFTYIPIANIEKKIDEATDKVDQVVQKTEDIENKIVEDATEEITKIRSFVCNLCQNLPTIGEKVLCAEICKILGGTAG